MRAFQARSSSGAPSGNSAGGAAGGGLCAVLSIRSLPQKHYSDGPEKDTEIQPHRPIANVILIQLNALFVRSIGTPRNLPEPGQSPFHLGIETEAVAVTCYLGVNDRTRSDKTHFPSPHIPELRQFIHTGSS